MTHISSKEDLGVKVPHLLVRFFPSFISAFAHHLFPLLHTEIWTLIGHLCPNCEYPKYNSMPGIVDNI